MEMNARKSEKMRIGVWGSVRGIALIVFASITANPVSANLVADSSPPQTAPVSTPSSSVNSCITWQTLKTAIQSGRVRSRLILPELPDGFKKGCVFYDEGAHTVNFHILKDGVSPNSVSVVAAQPYDSPISQIVPKAFIDDALMNRGQLLRVGFDSPGETDAAFIRKNAWERAFIRKSEDGRVTVIFRNLFMESKGVPPEVMARLLEATKSQFDKAQKKTTAQFDSAKNRNLLKAVHDGDLKAVRAALSEGADPNAEETYHEDTSDRVSITALELAAKSNRVEIAKTLIEHGAKVDRYPLVAAASQGYLEMVTLLLSKGAPVNASLSQGYTALLAAINGRHYQVAEVLLKHGANPNAFIEGGVSILFDAASRGDVEAVRLLIAHGADVNVGTVSGDRTPKAIAEQKGYTEIVNLLKQAGAQ